MDLQGAEPETIDQMEFLWKNDQDIHDICEELGEDELFKDETFGHTLEALCDAANEAVEYEGAEIEWIRASKLPCFVDDEGDTHMFKDEYTDAEDLTVETDLGREYTSTYPSTAIDAVFGHYSKFMQDSHQDKPYINSENLDKGIIQVVLRWNSSKYSIVVDDFLPCVDNEPIYAKARSGALWCSFVEKAMAKFFNSYSYLY